jgi:NAD(P)-dependent dehydrogenase (short-subunit alcohol dehydrogenase family)
MRVLVTAGANGIGHAIAKAFLAEGAEVWICDIDAPALAAAFTDDANVTGRQTDVSDAGQVEALFMEIHQGGALDVLVNNAGIGGPTGPIETMEPDAWMRTLQVNLFSDFLCCRQALPGMKARGSGAIINLSSTAGIMGYPLRTPYAAAKWGVVGLTKSLAMEVGPSGIRVNAICPGPILGDRMERVLAQESAARGRPADEIKDEYTRQTSLRSWIDGSEIADMAVFLASDKARHVSGQIIGVDGNTETLGM